MINMVDKKKATKKVVKKAEPKKELRHTCFPRSDKTLCEACVAAAEK